uniref:Uncharacterized protein n=1 Tax=Anguilla anguilla TaxID=7936 RepID=A0A0E9SWH6_ANGAN
MCTHTHTHAFGVCTYQNLLRPLTFFALFILHAFSPPCG